MSDTPLTYEAYQAQLKANTSWFERLMDNFTGSDDRLNLIAKIMLDQNSILRQAFIEPPLVSERAEYNIRNFDLGTARTSQQIEVSGNFVTAYTDGDPSTITLRFDSEANDAMLLSNFNSISLPFTKLFLSNTAQSNKVLVLFIGFRRASAGSMPVVDTSNRMSMASTSALYTLSTDPAVHFTGALAQYAKEDESLTGVLANKIKITGISIQSEQALDYYLFFWSKDTFDDATMVSDTFVGMTELDFTTWGQQVGGAGQYYFSVEVLDFDYEDRDNSKEIHCSLYNASPVSKTAGSAGYVKIDITYELRE